MRGRFLLAMLLALPVAAEAVICKTIGEDGVVSYADVPASECPVASRLPDYSPPTIRDRQAESVNTVSTEQEATFIDYRSIRIASPANNEAVHSSNRRVLVTVKLEPELQQNHFITIYLDNKAFSGRYGSSNIELTNVDPGTHKLRAIVIDTRGKSVIESHESSFTLLLPSRIRVTTVTRHIIAGTFEGHDVDGSPVTILFHETGNEFYGVVKQPDKRKKGTWIVKGKNLEGKYLSEEKGRFEVKIKEKRGCRTEKAKCPREEIVGLEFRKSDEKPDEFEPTYKPVKPDYEPKAGGITTTPGQTNPDLKPRYTPLKPQYTPPPPAKPPTPPPTSGAG